MRIGRVAWKRKSCSVCMETFDKLVEIVNEVQPGTTVDYRLHYIGLATAGVS